MQTGRKPLVVVVSETPLRFRFFRASFVAGAQTRPVTLEGYFKNGCHALAVSPQVAGDPMGFFMVAGNSNPDASLAT